LAADELSWITESIAAGNPEDRKRLFKLAINGRAD
jgi:hypothetical protein